MLVAGINRHAGGPDFFPANQRPTIFIFAVTAGFALYPSALGWGRFDVYTLGWNFSALTVAVGALAIGLIWRGQRFHLVLVAALLAWQLGLMESRNLWDYLVDPVLLLVSVSCPRREAGRSQTKFVARSRPSIITRHLSSALNQSPRARSVFRD